MRTTLSIEDDVLAAAKELAAQAGKKCRRSDLVVGEGSAASEEDREDAHAMECHCCRCVR